MSQLSPSNVSWKPARVLDIPSHLKDKAFTYRWVDGGSIRINQLLSEGWIVDKQLAAKILEMNKSKTIDDGEPLDSTLKVRELVLMKLPMELKAARDAFYLSRSNKTLGSAEHKTLYNTKVKK